MTTYWLSDETPLTVAAGVSATLDVDAGAFLQPGKRYRLTFVRAGKTASNVAVRVTAVRAGPDATALPGCDAYTGNGYGDIPLDADLPEDWDGTLEADLLNASAGAATLTVSFGIELDRAPGAP